MKIYFYDGMLEEAPSPPDSRFCLIDAGLGISENLASLETLKKERGSDSRAILTNSIIALDHRYAWNDKEDHTEIYMWNNLRGEYVRADELTDRCIRYAHRVSNMYLSGVFGYGSKLSPR